MVLMTTYLNFGKNEILSKIITRIIKVLNNKKLATRAENSLLKSWLFSNKV